MSAMMKLWDRIEETLVGLLGLIALVIGLWQVIGRYFAPERAISYAEEVIVYLVIWAIMFVSSQLVRRDGHVRSDVVLRKLPPQVAAHGWRCSTASRPSRSAQRSSGTAGRSSRPRSRSTRRSSTDLQFPLWIYYLSLPVGSALMAARYSDPPGPLRALFRSRDDDRWPHRRPRDAKRHRRALPSAGRRPDPKC